MKILFILGAIIASIFAAPEQYIEIKPAGIINDGLNNMVEKVRKQMVCGWPEHGISPMAPLLIGEQAFDMSLSGLNAVGYVKGVRVDGLNEFVVKSLDFVLFQLRLYFDMTLDKIRIDCDEYNLEGNLNQFYVHGSGRFDASVHNITIGGDARITVQGGRLHLSEMNVKVGVGSVKSNFEGLLSDNEMTTDLVNRVIEQLVPEMVQQNQPLITQMISDIGLPIANSFLNEMTLDDLLKIIRGSFGISSNVSLLDQPEC